MIQREFNSVNIPYLYGAKFVICADHEPLESLLSRGKLSVRADMLSRIRLVLEG